MVNSHRFRKTQCDAAVDGVSADGIASTREHNAALEAARYADFPRRRDEAKARGKLRGIGLSCYIEACGVGPSQAVGSLGAGVGLWESAEARVNPVGTIEILTGSHSHGQGHETTFAQLVAERFGVPVNQVSVGDVGDRELPHGRARRPCRTLREREVRSHADRLQLLSQ